MARKGYRSLNRLSGAQTYRPGKYVEVVEDYGDALNARGHARFLAGTDDWTRLAQLQLGKGAQDTFGRFSTQRGAI
jgi:hypothetical protein